MAVYHPKSDAEFEEFMQKNKHKTVIVDFYTEWCKPCKQMAPIFEEEANKLILQGNDSVVFAKVDAEACEKTAARHEVDSLPTFLVIKGKETIASMVGASRTKLPKFIKDHADL